MEEGLLAGPLVLFQQAWRRAGRFSGSSVAEGERCVEAVLLFRLLLVCVLCLLVATSAECARAVVLESADAAWTEAVRSEMETAGLTVVRTDADGLPEALKSKPDALVLPDARRFPAPALAPLMHYLSQGGCLTAVGAPAFETILVPLDGRWVSVSEAMEEIARSEPESLLFDFKNGDEKQWRRSTNHPEFDERLSVRDGALAGFVSDITGWNTYLSPPITGPISERLSLTVLEARADRNTPKIYIEWREKDGSRWIADLNVTEKWKRYVLTEQDFKFWKDDDSPARGGPGDHLNLGNARHLSIGLAENFGLLPRGEHLWWVRKIGLSADPIQQTLQAPDLQTLSPAYKLYKMDEVHRLTARSDQTIAPQGFQITGRLSGWMPIWRSRGAGYLDGAMPHARFIPVLDAFGGQGEWRGAAAWYYVHFSDEFKGGIWAGVGVEPESAPPSERKQLARLAALMTARMFSAPFLRAAGGADFALTPGGKTSLGACAASMKAGQTSVEVKMTLSQEGRERPLASGALSLPPGGEDIWRQPDVGYTLTPGPASLKTTLLAGGRPVDTITQPLSVLADHPKEFVQVRGGQFTYRGRPFYANGVNYFPRYITGVEPGEFKHSWLGPGRYDPEIVERDLRALEALNVNVVSIQYMRPGDGPQLVDFLERCRAHHIFANIFFEGANPTEINPGLIQAMVSTPGLRDNPQVFAYDLAWEPSLGRQDRRKAFDAQWNEWIMQQYGSLDRAAKDWDFNAAVPSGKEALSPTDDQLTTDGPWRGLVAAYRRFVDDIVSRGYGQVKRLIESLDPNHLVGARTGYGGTGQMWVVASMPFDLASGAAHLDFISPEGYGIVGDLDNYLAGGFTTEYARLVSGGKPVFWAEYGQSIWPDIYDADNLKRQALHYDRSYDLFIRSHANGSSAWWFPSGLRVDEVSDFGIVRQDSQSRPAGLVIRDRYAQAEKALVLPRSDETLTIDRDQFVTGYAGVWAAARERYLKAIKQGRRLVPVTDGSGTDSRTCPAVAVGDVPWTGDNPSKYLNAEIGAVQVQAASGEWQDALSQPVEVRKGQPLKLRISLTNSGEARWLAGADAGQVSIGYSSGQSAGEIPLPANVPALTEAPDWEITLDGLSESRLTLRMVCVGRGQFGQRVTARLHFVN